MSTDRTKPQTEPDQDAYEDAQYRALKAKASNRFADPKDDTTDAPQPPASPSTPAENDGDAAAR